MECPGVVPHLPPDVPEMRISLAVAAAPGVAVLYGQGLSPPNLGTSPALRHSHGGTGIESLHYPRFAARASCSSSHGAVSVALVLLMPARQQEANDLQVQVSALRQGESPKPRIGIATYLRRHFRLRRKSDTNRAGRNGVVDSD